MHLLPVASWDRKDATGGVVTRSYVSNLKNGRIENPGLVKLEALASAMSFPPALWFGEAEDRAPDAALMAALTDETVRGIVQVAVRLQDRDRRLLLGIAREIGPPTASA